MTSKPRFDIIILFCFISNLWLSLCIPTVTFADEKKYGGTLVFSAISDPKSFNDIIAKEASTSTFIGPIFEGLTDENAETLKIVPNLAERWEVDESGLVWTFYLRRDVKWNDGVPFTADDVVFTFNELIYNDKIPSSARDIFTIEGKIFNVEKVNDYTVRFTLPVKFAPFLRGMGSAILPKHKLKESVDSNTFNFTWGIDTDPTEIVGTGPFRMTEYHPGERVLYERNPYYWKKSVEGDQLPYIDKMVYIIMQNPDVALLKFMDGELDTAGVRETHYPLLKPKEKQGNFTIYRAGPNFGSSFLFFNQNPRVNPETGKKFLDPKKLAWFTDRRFRQAMAHAIDKQKMIEILKNGLGYPQNSPISPSAGFFYNPNAKAYEYDLDKARQFLASAGFNDKDGDGLLEDKNGNNVEFNLYTNANNPERIQIAAIIRHDLNQLGIKVNFLAMEFNTLVNKINSSFDWDAILLGLTGGVEPHFGQNVWLSSGQLHMWNPRQEKPATQWEARIDQIFTQGVQELDEDKRKVLYDEFQMIVSEELPLIYTILGESMYAVRNKFGNMRPTAYGGAFHNLEEIYILPEHR